MTRLAAIDTGTNSTRLLIAEPGPEGLREVVRQTEVTRLGEGVDLQGRLAPGARERVYACMGRYAAIIGELGVDRVLVVATSSVRDAADGESFLKELTALFKFDHLLLTGSQEAALAFSGALSGRQPGKKTMMFDVGGGSTEVVVGQDEEIWFAVSMDIGCVRIRERFFAEDPPSLRELQTATDFIDARLAMKLPAAEFSQVDQTLAVAGTVSALAALDRGLETYDRELVHGHTLTHKRISEMMAVLGRQSTAQRMQSSIMEPGRADVIVAGTLIVERLLAYCGLNEIIVSEHDILDGIALAMYKGRL